MSMVEKEAFLEILPTGQIKFNRDISKENRDIVLEIITDLLDNPQEVQKVKEFLDGANDIDVILGNRILCG